MNLERLIQMVLRIVVARGVGLVINRAMGWLERRGRAGAARSNPAGDDTPASGDPNARPAPGLDAKRLRQQMRMISRIGRMR